MSEKQEPTPEQIAINKSRGGLQGSVQSPTGRYSYVKEPETKDDCQNTFGRRGGR